MIRLPARRASPARAARDAAPDATPGATLDATPGATPGATLGAMPDAMPGVAVAVAAIVLAIAVAGAGCSPSAAQSAPPGAPPAMPVSVAPAQERKVADSAEFTGRFEAAESVDVRARASGTIQAVHFLAGQDVARDAALFTLDPRPYEAELARTEAQLQAARSQAELARAELERARRLVDAKAVSQQELDQLGAALRSAEAAVRGAEAAVRTARLNLDFTVVRAPIAGRVSRASVTTGNLVGVSEPSLTTLVALDPIHVYFDVDEAAYLRLLRAGRIASGRPERLDASIGLADDAGHPHAARVDFVDNRVSAQTGSVRMRAVVPNPARRFAPGMFARVRVTAGAPVAAVVVPDRAIGTDQNRRFVVVVGADNVAAPRPVALGPVVDGLRVVTQGLKAGELVVVNGLQRIRPGVPVAPQRVELDANGVPLEPPAPGGKR